MHVALRLGKTLKELYRDLDSPREIGEWLAFLGNPHEPAKAKKKQAPPSKTHEELRAWAERYNKQVKGKR